MKEINLTEQQFNELLEEHTPSISVFDTPSWEDQEIYGEPCWGTMLRMSIKLDDGTVVREQYTSSKGVVNISYFWYPN